MLLCMGALVVHLSQGTLNEPVFTVFKSMIKWLGFTILGAPDLNHLKDTWIILSGVTWSLPYECFFYLALPALALTVRKAPPLPYLVISAAGIIGAMLYRVAPPLLTAFGGGIAAALVVRSTTFCRLAGTALGSILAICCVLAVVVLFPEAHDYPQILLLSVAFALIAGGATLFGGLVTTVSRTLGEMAYSLYLLHGMLLFVTVNYIVGSERVQAMSAIGYWMLITAICPILIIGCRTTCRMIELPAMQHTNRITARLRSLSTRYTRRIA